MYDHKDNITLFNCCIDEFHFLYEIINWYKMKLLIDDLYDYRVITSKKDAFKIFFGEGYQQNS